MTELNQVMMRSENLLENLMATRSHNLWFSDGGYLIEERHVKSKDDDETLWKPCVKV